MSNGQINHEFCCEICYGPVRFKETMQLTPSISKPLFNCVNHCKTQDGGDVVPVILLADANRRLRLALTTVLFSIQYKGPGISQGLKQATHLLNNTSDAGTAACDKS